MGDARRPLSAAREGIDLAIDNEQREGLVRSVLASGHSREDAEDAVQDAWIVAAERADRLEPGPIGGFLRGTARFKAIPRMPSPNTVRRLFGSWREAVRAAGIQPAYGDRRVQRWEDAEMVAALCGWRLRNSRWPGPSDMAADPTLPSPATTRRRFGTDSARKLAPVVLGLLA